MKRFILLAISLSACKWTDFDNLADQTWVRSQQKPSIGSTDYALSITGATIGSDGGTVAVVSTDAPTFSTINYDAKGGDKVGDNPLKLGQHFITSLGEKPILVNDGKGNVALVEKAIDAGKIAVVAGPASSPADLVFVGPPPDAATYAGTNLYIAAQATGPAMPNLFIDDGTANMPGCALLENDGTTPMAAAAVAADATRLWVWSKTGPVYSYDLTALTGTCTGATASMPFAHTFSPGTGARINIISDGAGHEWAVLAAHADKATNGEVVVLDLTKNPPTQVGTTIAIDGLLSSTAATFDSKDYVVLGIPSKDVNGTAAGQVEIHDFDPVTGTLADMPSEVLNDAQPENGQLFGRDVATMQFNGKTILVVAASNEVFAYYRTSLYPTDTRNPPP